MSGDAMKAVFVGINLCLATACIFFGLAALLSVATAAYSYTYGVVGVFALLVAGICLWMCCECGSARQKDPA
jgi:hypothetical protein